MIIYNCVEATSYVTVLKHWTRRSQGHKVKELGSGQHVQEDEKYIKFYWEIQPVRSFVCLHYISKFIAISPFNIFIGIYKYIPLLIWTENILEIYLLFIWTEIVLRDFLLFIWTEIILRDFLLFLWTEIILRDLPVVHMNWNYFKRFSVVHMNWNYFKRFTCCSYEL